MSVVARFLFSADVFVLEDAMETVPETTIRLEPSVSARRSLVPLLRTQTPDTDGFEQAASEDSTVESVSRVDGGEPGSLFRVEWTALETRPLFGVFERTETLLDAVGSGGDWRLTIRFDSSAALPTFQRHCVSEDIGFELLELRDAESSDRRPYGVSDPQREAILVALRMGYYDIPRRCTLGDVAQSLDISTHAASERLRRGQTNLVEQTLTTEQPTESFGDPTAP